MNASNRNALWPQPQHGVRQVFAKQSIYLLDAAYYGSPWHPHGTQQDAVSHDQTSKESGSWVTWPCLLTDLAASCAISQLLTGQLTTRRIKFRLLWPMVSLHELYAAPLRPGRDCARPVGPVAQLRIMRIWSSSGSYARVTSVIHLSGSYKHYEWPDSSLLRSCSHQFGPFAWQRN